MKVYSVIIFVVVVIVVMVLVGTSSSSTPPPDDIRILGVPHKFPPAALQSNDNFLAYKNSLCEKADSYYTINNPFGTFRCFTYYWCMDDIRMSCFSNFFYSYYHQDCVPYEESDCYYEQLESTSTS
uniref:Chitin-binding type-2 domain-containing protein n=1 Tax=Erinnyis ello granulovirus TaxID=307444 RepID=A0A288WJA0_9BBAC|nr:hypothetical protein EREL_056 [Erinnyis ello granulovirus]ARX71525.1 hypothetical protein EREL_056 [Erinnyis ello granulovirus]ARX71915.1 hypothetical protein EREL_056 [Erinnyis ello granulovirus]ARX72045.1 hypothetical protein EREL_056 [Erinnyis ello granulovirus]